MMEDNTEYIFRRRKLLLTMLFAGLIQLLCTCRFWNNEFVDDLLTDRTARNLLYVEACGFAIQ